MKKDDLFIGMLCSCSKGTGVISWVDESANHVYLSDVSTQPHHASQHYKVKIDEIDLWLDKTMINNK